MGPAVAAIPFGDEEAAALANASRFGLADAARTRDIDRAHRITAWVSVGTFWMGGYRTISAMAPFGGLGASGHGCSSSFKVLQELTRSKAVWVEMAGCH